MAEKAPIPTIYAGALIGRVNSGKPFSIGNTTQAFQMPANGTLFLGVNDDHVPDNSGAVERNAKLSQERAEAVKKYLVSRGVDTARLIAVGYGSTRPVADNGTVDGRGKNRRVEFRLVSGGTQK